MLHELINAELIDRHIYREIDIVCDMVVDFIAGGCIKYLAKNLFCVILFSDLQVKLSNQVIMSKENRLYLDATGSVINKVPDQSSKVGKVVSIQIIHQFQWLNLYLIEIPCQPF